MSNIGGGLKAAGIFPFDRDVFPEDSHVPSSVTVPDIHLSNIY
jgi:hypothetical protein